jgi:diacylglycerol kinase family enzyme
VRPVRTDTDVPVEEGMGMSRTRHHVPRVAVSSRHWNHVASPRRPVLVVNPRSGDGAAARLGIVEEARDRGIRAVVLGPREDPSSVAREALADGADALGVAGGDGSLSAVAAVAAAHSVPFVCIPAGTRNHFALDVGVDRRDVLGALDAFTDGVESLIDVGEVNGRIFLNNVSLGIYGEAVQLAGYRDTKVRTLAETARGVLSPSGRTPSLRCVDDTGREHTRLAVLLVSNNPYALAGPAPGTRPTLAGGRLGILVLDTPDEMPHPPGRAWSAHHLEVTAAGTVHAGIDGEAAELAAPLEFAVRPAALRVRIARRHPGASPSARPPFPAPRRAAAPTISVAEAPAASHTPPSPS